MELNENSSFSSRNDNDNDNGNENEELKLETAKPMKRKIEKKRILYEIRGKILKCENQSLKEEDRNSDSNENQSLKEDKNSNRNNSREEDCKNNSGDFSQLPIELFLNISIHLYGSDVCNWMKTCRYFFNLMAVGGFSNCIWDMCIKSDFGIEKKEIKPEYLCMFPSLHTYIWIVNLSQNFDNEKKKRFNFCICFENIMSERFESKNCEIVWNSTCKKSILSLNNGEKEEYFISSNLNHIWEEEKIILLCPKRRIPIAITKPFNSLYQNRKTNAFIPNNNNNNNNKDDEIGENREKFIIVDCKGENPQSKFIFERNGLLWDQNCQRIYEIIVSDELVNLSFQKKKKKDIFPEKDKNQTKTNAHVNQRDKLYENQLDKLYEKKNSLAFATFQNQNQKESNFETNKDKFYKKFIKKTIVQFRKWIISTFEISIHNTKKSFLFCITFQKKRYFVSYEDGGKCEIFHKNIYPCKGVFYPNSFSYEKSPELFFYKNSQWLRDYYSANELRKMYSALYPLKNQYDIEMKRSQSLASFMEKIKPIEQPIVDQIVNPKTKKPKEIKTVSALVSNEKKKEQIY